MKTPLTQQGCSAQHTRILERSNQHIEEAEPDELINAEHMQFQAMAAEPSDSREAVGQKHWPSSSETQFPPTRSGGA